MTTITFDENINLDKNHFKSVDDFQLYIARMRQKGELSDYHKEILDERLFDAENNPDNFLSLKELKSSITRR